jgi:hypothetical protein
MNLMGVASVSGGVGFFGFWMGSLLKVELAPWPVALLWHAIATLLLVIGAVGIHRSSHGSPTQTLLGWLGAAFVGAGQMFSLELTMLGCLLFGARVAMAPRLPRSAAPLLILGALGFLATLAVNGPFSGDMNSRPTLVPALAFGVSLLLIAVGWIVLGLSLVRGDTSSASVLTFGRRRT